MKHKKGKSTLSFKFLNNRYGHEHNTEQHQYLKTDIEHKIDLLRLPVYQKKPKSKITNSIKFAMPERDKIKKQLKTSARRQHQNDEQNLTASQHYKYKKMSKTSYGNLLNRNVYNKTVTQFKFKIKQENDPKEKDKEDKEQAKFDQIVTSAAKLKEIHYQPHKQIIYRDSQSLLRKNSLYLSNFVKRRQKQFQEKPHIAYIPNVAQNMKIKSSPKKQFQHHNSSKELKKVKEKKEKKEVNNVQKIFNNMPIDPW